MEPIGAMVGSRWTTSEGMCQRSSGSHDAWEGDVGQVVEYMLHRLHPRFWGQACSSINSGGGEKLWDCKCILKILISSYQPMSHTSRSEESCLDLSCHDSENRKIWKLHIGNIRIFSWEVKGMQKQERWHRRQNCIHLTCFIRRCVLPGWICKTNHLRLLWVSQCLFHDTVSYSPRLRLNLPLSCTLMFHMFISHKSIIAPIRMLRFISLF